MNEKIKFVSSIQKKGKGSSQSQFEVIQLATRIKQLTTFYKTKIHYNENYQIPVRENK
jgi:hypothetical protein